MATLFGLAVQFGRIRWKSWRETECRALALVLVLGFLPLGGTLALGALRGESAPQLEGEEEEGQPFYSNQSRPKKGVLCVERRKEVPGLP